MYMLFKCWPTPYNQLSDPKREIVVINFKIRRLFTQILDSLGDRAVHLNSKGREFKTRLSLFSLSFLSGWMVVDYKALSNTRTA